MPDPEELARVYGNWHKLLRNARKTVLKERIKSLQLAAPAEGEESFMVYLPPNLIDNDHRDDINTPANLPHPLPNPLPEEGDYNEYTDDEDDDCLVRAGGKGGSSNVRRRCRDDDDEQVQTQSQLKRWPERQCTVRGLVTPPATPHLTSMSMAITPPSRPGTSRSSSVVSVDSRRDVGDSSSSTVASVAASGSSLSTAAVVSDECQYSFMSFPGEIRNMIYKMSLWWPDSFEQYSAYNRRIDEYYLQRNSSSSSSPANDKGKNKEHRFPVHHRRRALHTPTILLLCRTITAEALPILHATSLVIDRIPPWVPNRSKPLLVTDFIGKRTLQCVKRIEVKIQLGDGRLGSAWIWVKLLEDVLSVLRKCNSFTTLRVMIKLANLELRHLWLKELEGYDAIKTMIRQFEGTNPQIWTPGKIGVEHWIVDYNYAYKIEEAPLVTPPRGRRPTREVRVYPDNDIWQGSILEFL